GDGHYLVVGLFLLLLGIVFIGMGATVLAVVQGTPPEQKSPTGFQDGFRTGVPILLFMALVLLFGLYVPPPLEALLSEAAKFLEAKPGTEKRASGLGGTVRRSQGPRFPYCPSRTSATPSCAR